MSYTPRAGNNVSGNTTPLVGVGLITKLTTLPIEVDVAVAIYTGSFPNEEMDTFNCGECDTTVTLVPLTRLSQVFPNWVIT